MHIVQMIVCLAHIVEAAKLSNFERRASSTCKVSPSSPNWPSAAAWNALNQSISGHLIASVPPGAVCHPSRPEYNAASCATVTQQWTTETFHWANPVSVDYNDDTCPPNASVPCSNDGYPAYVIDAQNYGDVQQGVTFAAKMGVRLIVKSTGHNFPGRSSGRGSLSIWTHNLRSVTITTGNGDSSVGSVGTAEIGAGTRVSEIFSAAAAKSVTIVTGSDPGVSLGGWVTGAGHSPISSKYGMGADQVLAMQVVTADGSYIKLDPNTNSDLFWAMRGGGGSTFGVLISATVRVYPNLPFIGYLFSYNTTSNTDTFWQMTTIFHEYIPQVSESGGMGYYYVTPYTAGVAAATAGSVSGIFLFPSLSATKVTSIMGPLESAIRKGPGLTDPVVVAGYAVPYASYSASWPTIASAQAVGVDARLGSRLFDKAALTGNTTGLNHALRTSTPPPNTLLGNMVAGPGPRNVKIPGGSDAVLPAWRSSYSHMILPRGLYPYDPTANAAAESDLRDVRTAALVQQAPNTGAYLSEADPTTADWQSTFWGSNYPRLKSIKDKWDPNGVFFCQTCVGFEEWTITGGDVIGQDPGNICRSS